MGNDIKRKPYIECKPWKCSWLVCMVSGVSSPLQWSERAVLHTMYVTVNMNYADFKAMSSLKALT